MPDSTHLLVAGSGNVYVADVGTTAPADVTTAWPAGWTNLGFVSDDGMALTRDVTREDKRSWQSLAVIRSIYTEVSLSLKFSLDEWNTDTLPVAFGGGSWVTSGTVSKFEFPSSPSAAEKAFGFEWSDPATGVHNRLIVARAQATASGDITFKGTDLALIPIELTALATDISTPLAYLLSDAAGLVP